MSELEIMQIEVIVKGDDAKKVFAKATIKASTFLKGLIPNPMFFPTLVKQVTTGLWRVRMEVGMRQEETKVPDEKKTKRYLAMRSRV